MESTKASLLPKIIFYGLLINCFIIFNCISIAIFKEWYIVNQQIPVSAIAIIMSWDLYKEQVNFISYSVSGGQTKVTQDTYYTKTSKKDKLMERFLTVGVFEYFSLLLVVALFVVTIMSHFKKNNIFQKVIIGMSAVLALFQIIIIGVIRSLPSAFNLNGECVMMCKHFSGSENDVVWGPSTGFHAGVSALGFSIIGLLLSAFLKYYYSKHHQETSYLDEYQLIIEEIN